MDKIVPHASRVDCGMSSRSCSLPPCSVSLCLLAVCNAVCMHTHAMRMFAALPRGPHTTAGVLGVLNHTLEGNIHRFTGQHRLRRPPDGADSTFDGRGIPDVMGSGGHQEIYCVYDNVQVGIAVLCNQCGCSAKMRSGA